MFDTFSILIVLALVLTVISLRWYNLLLSFVACMAWVSLWAYNLSNPPTGITQGSFVHEVLVYSFIVMAIGVMLLYFRNRGEAKNMLNANTDKEGVPPKSEQEFEPRKSIMNTSVSEYRQNLRGRINRRNTGRRQ